MQGAGKVGLHEDVTDFWRRVLRQVDFAIRGPATVVVGVLGDRLGHQFVHDKAIAGRLKRALGDLAKAHRAELLQRRDIGVGRGWHHVAQHPVGHVTVMLADQPVDIGGARPATNAADRRYLAAWLADHDRCDPGDVDQVALHYAQGHGAGDAGINGVAAGFQDCVTGLGRQRVACRHHVGVAVNCRTISAHDRSAKSPC